MSDTVWDATASGFEWNDETIKVWNAVVARRGLRATEGTIFADMAAAVSPAPKKSQVHGRLVRERAKASRNAEQQKAFLAADSKRSAAGHKRSREETAAQRTASTLTAPTLDLGDLELGYLEFGA